MQLPRPATRTIRPSEHSNGSDGQVHAAWNLLSPDLLRSFIFEGKLLTTCKEIQVTNNVTKDGDYDLNVRGRVLKVPREPLLTDFHLDPATGKCFLDVCVFPSDPLLRHAAGEP